MTKRSYIVKMNVEEILNATRGKLLIGDLKEDCENFCTDTRKILENDVYVGLKGENFNGNEYYEEALKRGAKVAIVSGIEIPKEKLEQYKNKTIIEVDDSLIAFGKIAEYKRSLYDIPVIQVTGSVGKTSTRDIIANVIRTKYKTLQTEGNLNNHIGLPTTILKLKDHEALVVESGMNHLGEISYLGKITKPTIAVITNVGTAHIGLLGSRENILKAKLEILENLKPEGTIVINNDNDMLNKWAKEDKVYKKYTFGIDEKSDVMAYNIKIGNNSSTYNVKINNEEYTVNVPVSGKHFVYNSLCAIAVGNLLGISSENIIKGIETFSLTKNRMEVVKVKDNVTVINDAYNASYDSMKPALEYLSELPANRKIAVLGDMFELGEFSEEIHRKVGIEVVTHKIDILVTVGKLAKYIAEEAKYLRMPEENIISLETTEEASEYLNEILQKDDAVLLKAAHGMHFSEIFKSIKD
ncbi:MAG TPA: UDP-N-acetylmuramoyl-tripeptide--D-alanyl-D-alanine ligase [Clostridiaceae bacterium]|nr:UDP-N-acetylmuramoyl-tripeptide--D-alanyl-D-alanine ligase [Clostridiaceae bacterium]